MKDKQLQELQRLTNYIYQDMNKLVSKLYCQPKQKVPKLRRSIYIDQENTEQLFLDFLRMKLGNEYYQKGLEAFKNQIFRVKDENGEKFSRSGSHPSGEFYQIELNYNLSDVTTYAHEFMHYIQNYTTVTTLLLNETMPLFIEQLMVHYLKEQFPNEKKVYSCDFERYQNHLNLIQNEYIFICEEHMKNIYSLFSMKYIFGLLISCKLYRDYLLSEKTALNEIKSFLLALEQNDFNQAMQAVGLNISYKEHHLYYSDYVLKLLIESFHSYYNQLFDEYKTLKKIKFIKR